MKLRKVPMRAPILLATGFAGVLLAGYLGYQAYAGLTVDRMTFAPISPGRVSLFAIDPGAGYSVLVSNGIAHLAELADRGFGPAQDLEQRDAQAQNKRRLPIREMLQALQGDEAALSAFVMSVNEIEDKDLPTVRVYWDSEDVAKALDGDVVLRNRLEEDLGVGLDGTPKSELRLGAIENGIVLRLPVPVRVRVGPEVETLTARVLEPFQPSMLAAVRMQYADRHHVTPELIASLYKAQALKVLGDPTLREDVAAKLRSQTAAERVAKYAGAPERVLASARVIVNESLIESARYSVVETPNGRPTFNLSLGLTHEGRMRLWKHSRAEKEFILLLVVDGVAIAAPRITHELPQSEVTMTQLPDERLVRDAVRIMEQGKS